MGKYTFLDIVGKELKNPYLYSCACLRVIDGDTVDLEVDLGFNMKKRERFRLDGYDTPETWNPITEAERRGGERCKEYLVKLTKRGPLVIQSLYKGIYGRMGGRLFYWDSENQCAICINELMQQFMDENKLDKEALRAIKDFE